MALVVPPIAQFAPQVYALLMTKSTLSSRVLHAALAAPGWQLLVPNVSMTTMSVTRATKSDPPEMVTDGVHVLLAWQVSALLVQSSGVAVLQSDVQPSPCANRKEYGQEGENKFDFNEHIRLNKKQHNNNNNVRLATQNTSNKQTQKGSNAFGTVVLFTNLVVVPVVAFLGNPCPKLNNTVTT